MIRRIIAFLVGRPSPDREAEVLAVRQESHDEVERARRLRALTYEWEVRARRPGGRP